MSLLAWLQTGDPLRWTIASWVLVVAGFALSKSERYGEGEYLFEVVYLPVFVVIYSLSRANKKRSVADFVARYVRTTGAAIILGVPLAYLWIDVVYRWVRRSSDIYWNDRQEATAIAMFSVTILLVRAALFYAASSVTSEAGQPNASSDLPDGRDAK